MRTIAPVGWVVVVAAILGSAGAAPAQSVHTTLPEIVVTAPRLRPPVVAPSRGMVGDVRVDERRWRQVPCSRSRMAAAAAGGKCQEGAMVLNTTAFMGTGADPFSNGDCKIAHPLITTRIGRFAVEADVLVFDPYKVTADIYNGSCTVWSGYENMPADFKDMNRVARRGTGWHDFRPGGEAPGAQSTIAFYDGAARCIALERLGPPWHGGYVWVLHATLCEAATAPPIGVGDIDAAVAGLHIRVYDPDGNLRPPPRG